jgi:MOSC domain-containing protein YiiM
MMDQAGQIVGLQAGRVKRLVMPDHLRVDYRHANWTSGIFKDPIHGTLIARHTGLEGDQQADLDNHGGPDNVLLAYDADHYPAWRDRLGLPDMPFGAFGENLTVQGFTDDTVCIGDQWEIGGEGALWVEVTQARQPCYKLARRLQQPHIVKMVHESGWGGWYLRVLREGPVAGGMTVRRVARRHPRWTVVRAVQTMYARKKDPAAAAALAALPELSARWKRELRPAEG